MRVSEIEVMMLVTLLVNCDKAVKQRIGFVFIFWVGLGFINSQYPTRPNRHG